MNSWNINQKTSEHDFDIHRWILKSITFDFKTVLWSSRHNILEMSLYRKRNKPSQWSNISVISIYTCSTIEHRYHLINVSINRYSITWRKKQRQSWMLHDILQSQIPIRVVNRWSNSHTVQFGAVQEIFHQYTGLLQTSGDQSSYVIKWVKAF